jgi:hypothetical protein
MTAERLADIQEMLKQFGPDGWKIGKGRVQNKLGTRLYCALDVFARTARIPHPSEDIGSPVFVRSIELNDSTHTGVL